MFRLATSPIAPRLSQRLPVRAQTRLLNRSYLQMQRSVGQADRVLTTNAGDLFHADLSTFQEWHRWAYGSTDDQLAQLFSSLIQPGDRCLDVGAGIGLHTVRLAKLTGPTGEVIAIELDPQMARRAASNITLNRLTNARVILAAALDTSGAQAAELTGSPAQAPTITLDGAFAGPVALVKIDIGGREGMVVTGAAATIGRDHPAIIFEYVPELLDKTAPCPFGCLSEVGYLLYRIGSKRNPLTGRCALRLEPLYARPEAASRILAVAEGQASRIISLVAFRDSRK